MVDLNHLKETSIHQYRYKKVRSLNNRLQFKTLSVSLRSVLLKCLYKQIRDNID